MASPAYFEDFESGMSYEFGEYYVTEEEILQFATMYDPQPFHLSDEEGKKTLFGGLCASGWHICSMAMSMIVGNMPKGDTGTLGSPGIDELRWHKPVFPGDTLRMKTTKNKQIGSTYSLVLFLNNTIDLLLITKSSF